MGDRFSVPLCFDTMMPYADAYVSIGAFLAGVELKQIHGTLFSGVQVLALAETTSRSGP